jgi:hypothetical protein
MRLPALSRMGGPGPGPVVRGRAGRAGAARPGPVVRGPGRSCGARPVVNQDATGASAEDANAWMGEVERSHGRYVADIFT